MTRPRIANPRLEYSNRVPGAQLKRTPLARKAAKSSSGRPCCRSPHGSSVGNPAVMVSRCLIEIGAASGLTGGQSRSSGTYAPAGSSSPSTPSSRSARTADAVKLLVIDAILKTVASSGAGPPRARSPSPDACTSSPSTTTPPGIGLEARKWEFTLPIVAAVGGKDFAIGRVKHGEYDGPPGLEAGKDLPRRSGDVKSKRRRTVGGEDLRQDAEVIPRRLVEHDVLVNQNRDTSQQQSGTNRAHDDQM